MKGGDSARLAPPLQQQGGRGLLSNPGPMNDLVYRFPKGQGPNLGNMAGGLAQWLAQKGGMQNGIGQSMPQHEIQAWGGSQQRPQMPMQQAVGNPDQMNQWNALPQAEQQKYFDGGGAPDFARPSQTGGPAFNRPQTAPPLIGSGQPMGNNMNQSAPPMPRQDRDPNAVANRQAQRQAYLQRTGR